MTRLLLCKLIAIHWAANGASSVSVDLTGDLELRLLVTEVRSEEVCYPGRVLVATGVLEAGVEVHA